ncbi:MAG: CAP domain-containing protein [Calothrix sp. MO_192.B10]|nr:CAP domain-containing protein [Calothrix sp. MO_192.B10]
MIKNKKWAFAKFIGILITLLGTSFSLAEPAMAAADLIVRQVTTGSPRIRGNQVEVPIRVIVQNIGNQTAGIFKVSTEYTSRRGTYAVPFTTGDNIWYPYTERPLAPGRSIPFDGTVTFHPSVKGQRVSLRAIADSCSGDEFMPPHCRVRESDENNNKSANITLSLPSSSGSSKSSLTGNQIQKLLAVHNKYRSQVRIPLLKWSNQLAQSAQNWANKLAATGQFQHSGSGYGENIWWGTQGAYSLSQMVDSWGSEKQYFIANSTFPNTCRGGWQKCGHYTQMVWKNTKEVGCGLSRGAGRDILVCQYNPPGNVSGQKVY